MNIGRNLRTPIETLYGRAKANPDGIAFVSGRDGWRYGRLAAQIRRLARGLSERGIRKGDRIVLHLPGRPEFVVAVYACFHIGAIAVPLDGTMQAAEIERLLQRLRPSACIGDATLYGKLGAIGCFGSPSAKRLIVGSPQKNNGAVLDVESWASLLGDRSGPPPVSADIHSAAVLSASQGKIGVSDDVIHTHARLSALFALPFMGC
jgi:long-chain acyl-CoA synthetase